MDDPLNPGTPLSRVDSVKTAMRQATPTLTIPDGAFSFSHRPSGPTGVWTAGPGGPTEIDKVTVGYTWNLFCPAALAVLHERADQPHRGFGDEERRGGAMKKDDTSSGQSLLEFAIILPLVMVLVLGVIEVGYGLLDQHVITKLAREGSNLISRNTTLTAAGDVMMSMATRPVNFAPGGVSKVIFSVVKKGTTSGTPNFNQDILYQRHIVGNGKRCWFERADHRKRKLAIDHGLHGRECRQQHGPPGHRPAGESRLGWRFRLHHRDLHEAHADHALRPFRRDGSECALFDRVFLNADESEHDQTET